MKRFYGSLFSAIIILAVSAPALAYGASVSPASAAPKDDVSPQKTVTASAVIVPAQVSELGFMISGIARDVPVKEGDTVKAGQTLMVLDTPDLEFEVNAARADVRAAQAEEEIRRTDLIKKYLINWVTFTVKKLRLSVPHEEIEIANARIEQARASVEIANANLAQGTLIAPHDGTITSLSVIPGEFVPSDQVVVTLATLNALQVETTDLSERDIPNVHIGDSANIFVEALNANISGKVIAVSPMASPVNGDVIFKVTIAPDTQPEGLLWGMTTRVDIESGE